MNLAILQLGRLGDLCSCLEIAYSEYLQGRRATIICSREFSPLMEGQGYADCFPVDYCPDDLPKIIPEMRKRYGDALRVCQSWKNLDQEHQTPSYQMEVWRRAGMLDRFGTTQLVFDRRDKEREARFCSQFDFSKPVVLVAAKSPSSPYPHSKGLEIALCRGLPEANVINISEFHAPKPYDLLGLFDRATALVSIDTFPLHLSRAARIPTVAILNNVTDPSGWLASVPPPGCVSWFGYSVRPEVCADEVVSAVRKIVYPSKVDSICHCCQLFGNTPRHARAQATWGDRFSPCFTMSDRLSRSSIDIGDTRSLPYLKDVLEPAMRSHSSIILLTNDDNQIGQIGDAVRLAQLYGAVSIRRTEPETRGVHCGREAFIFTKTWLQSHWDEIPDFLLGAPDYDLCLAAMIRKDRGIVTTKENLTTDFWPADVGEGVIFHEAHPSAWSGPRENVDVSNLHNRKLFRAWASSNLPSLQFDGNNNLSK